MRLRYTRPALADLAGILDFIATQSPQGAARVHARIEAILRLLAEQPHLGIRTDDPAIRRITTPPFPFLIFYEIAAGEIVVHAVRHGARDPSGMPGEGP